MTVSKIYIENHIAELNLWITTNAGHELMRIKKNELAYYAGIAQEMDETGATRINLKNYKRKAYEQ